MIKIGSGRGTSFKNMYELGRTRTYKTINPQPQIVPNIFNKEWESCRFFTTGGPPTGIFNSIEPLYDIEIDDLATLSLESP